MFLLVKLPMLRHIPRLGFYPKQVIVFLTVAFNSEWVEAEN